MNGPQAGADPGEVLTLYCTQCGKAMRVAPAHVHTRVACPHCHQVLEPWRVAASATASTPPDQPLPPPIAPVAHDACCGYGYGPQGQSGYSWRNRWVAGALGVLLGAFGVHRFYLGFIGIGIIQIVVTIITFGIGSIWGFIEGILCFCGAMRDVDGLPLSG